jgi:ATP-dependent Clp protease ATP-binding subunit ClpB
MFKPLTKENISGIVDLLMKDLNSRVAEKEISISLTDAARDFVIDRGYDPVYGARPLKRFLQKNVETLVARAILSNTLAVGDNVLIDVDGGSLICRKD